VDAIGLIARPDEPDADPVVLNFATTERLWSRFNVRSLIPYGELRYEPTGRRFFGTCVCPCRSSLVQASPSDPHDIAIALLR